MSFCRFIFPQEFPQLWKIFFRLMGAKRLGHDSIRPSGLQAFFSCFLRVGGLARECL
jgi:hypothetical protein